MRTWHRWLSVFFSAFMLFIAVTGVLSHVAALWPQGDAPPPAEAPAGFACPEGWRCSPPRAERSGLGQYIGFFHHLHSGEEFGPVGVAISIASGLALIFFSISGFWLYLQMFKARSARGLTPKWFWK